MLWARIAGQMFGLFSPVALMDLAKAGTDLIRYKSNKYLRMVNHICRWEKWDLTCVTEENHQEGAEEHKYTDMRHHVPLCAAEQIMGENDCKSRFMISHNEINKLLSVKLAKCSSVISIHCYLEVCNSSFWRNVKEFLVEKYSPK